MLQFYLKKGKIAIFTLVYYIIIQQMIFVQLLFNLKYKTFYIFPYNFYDKLEASDRKKIK